jgi:hypothetical protein
MKLLKILIAVIALTTVVLVILTIPLRQGFQHYYQLEQDKLKEIISGTGKFDYLFIGSSRTYYHVHPKIIDSSLNVNSFNAGLDGARLTEINMVLKCYLAVHQKPAYIVADISTNSFDINRAPIFNPNIYYPFLNSPIVYKTISRYKRAGLLRALPFLRVAEWDEYLKAGAFKGSIGKSPIIPRNFKGYLESGNDTIKFPFKRFYQTSDFPVRPEGIMLLEEIIKLCSDNGVKLVLTYAPVYYQDSSVINPGFFTTLRSISEKYQIPFLDYRELQLNKNHLVFRDEHHLNTSGAEMYSRILADDLRNLDRRNNPKTTLSE